MDSQKPLQFSATPGSYFVLTIVSIILAYIPWFGWALLLNYSSEWFADRALVNGKKIAYKAGYGESLKFVFVNSLLIFITFGIYSFWFYPKMYRYVVDHTSYADETVAAPVAEAPASETPADPATPTAPSGPATA